MNEQEKKVLVELWNKIRKKRIELKLSQSDLSEKSSIDRSYLSMVESWKTNITFLKLKKIEYVLGEIS